MEGSWVPVGLLRDLGPGQVMPARAFGVDLAVWRSATGRLAAWNDRCPHRGMRLSHGFVRGETLACIYHGWTYGADGACRRIPAHPELVPPAAIKAEAWAVAEAGGAIFVGRGGDEPVLDGWTGLRSVPFDRWADLPGFVLQGPLWVGGNLGLLVQPRAMGAMVHALYCGGDPLAQSARLEALRREVEGVA